MKQHLIEKRGYRQDHIVVLTEDEPAATKKPTGGNIMHELSNLILKGHTAGAKELWFHYSGHGSSTRDRDGDEDDHKDETIVPLDYQRGGMITDDQLHDYIEHVAKGCKMYCIFDCCHSGTILDLKYQYRGNSRNGIENPSSRVNSDVIMISGCKDDQTSADAWIKGKWRGAMTTAYVNCTRNGIACEDLLDAMRGYLKNNHYTQYPQMCSSDQITHHELW